MFDKFFSFSEDTKKEIIEKIKNILIQEEYIVFAYIFGSFAYSDRFNDIDIAIYIKDSPKDKESILKLELELERKVEDKINIPTDVRLINNAPLGFVYNVLSNKIVIIDRDIDLRADFESLIFRKYFDYKHLIEEYLREIKNAPI
ncbi:nucleotidyltransferase domain-containing protein [Dictyoglomus thermophilum]|uniref:Nucleotidyltransferase n=1 Tax=Dictyoglomus thermophilum (strain ATCC 35947 / DSM 3960 / H-6-12) TaxID=309799 RepID=B5YB97_DICT6|nr:nucleotidyltransferase domain-containing protein [Dictyoglomus thermophilum]ACI19703.1 nucleotidyltransferase [Dictyoglomus thermophilum H-6-12]